MPTPGLSAGDLELTLAPEVGGAVRSLTWRGRDVLRPLPEGSVDPLQSGCFPLVPFANRIGLGRFVHDGHEVILEPDPEGAPHALHGHGWRAAWTIAEAAAGALALVYEHAAGEGGWPWRYRARQRFRLDADGLCIDLEVENLDEEAMPVGLGLHPYFAAAAGVHVRAEVEAVWLNGPDQLPVRLAPADALADFRGGAVLPGPRTIDNCHAGWSGRAEIRTRDAGAWTLTASSDLRWLHVFAPSGADFVCLEPVSQMPNAANRPEPASATGRAALSPGRTRSCWMRLELKEPAA